MLNLLSFFQSISHNNGAVTKKNYFSPTFLKSWAQNVVGEVAGPQY